MFEESNKDRTLVFFPFSVMPYFAGMRGIAKLHLQSQVPSVLVEPNRQILRNMKTYYKAPILKAQTPSRFIQQLSRTRIAPLHISHSTIILCKNTTVLGCSKKKRTEIESIV